jgi:linoleoyl-CoA desaturase
MNIPTIKFAKNHNEEFYKVLRQRVSEYFKSNNISRHANANMVVKTIFMLALYFVPLLKTGCLLHFCGCSWASGWLESVFR